MCFGIARAGVAGATAEANPVVCARGAYHAGPHGAVATTHRGYGCHAAAVVRPAPTADYRRSGSASAADASPALFCLAELEAILNNRAFADARTGVLLSDVPCRSESARLWGLRSRM